MQGFQHTSGNYIFKYSMGQALQFLPAFAVANALAPSLGYPADGYSLPYQIAIALGSMLLALLGLWVARWNLLQYFSDKATALTLLLITLATNYLNYAAIDNAMTHNWLFACYSLIVFFTIKFYRKPGYLSAAMIGLFCGWAALTRPTEAISVLIPLLWGVANWTTFKARILFARTHFAKYLLAGLLFGAVGFLQLLYWKYAGKEWLIYSYQDQIFNWEEPHIMEVLFSYRAGWLVYSPIMLTAVIGLFALRRQKPELFPVSLIFLLLNIYVVSAWSIWWYGGSLGMRAMVQSYALWIFPFAAAMEWLLRKNWRLLAFAPIALIGIWMNLWWTNQATKARTASYQNK